jgi:hypothetical protein
MGIFVIGIRVVPRWQTDIQTDRNVEANNRFFAIWRTNLETKQTGLSTACNYVVYSQNKEYHSNKFLILFVMETVYFLRGTQSILYHNFDELEPPRSYVHIIPQLTQILINVIFKGILFAAVRNLSKLRKSTTNFVISLCPSHCPHWTTTLSLNGFS